MTVGDVVGALCALLFVEVVSLLLVCRRHMKQQSDGPLTEEARSATYINCDIDCNLKAVAISVNKEKRTYQVPGRRYQQGTSATGERTRKYIVVM